MNVQPGCDDRLVQYEDRAVKPHCCPLAIRLLALMLLVASGYTTGCTYLHYAAVQRDYRAAQEDRPRQWLSKHLIDTQTWFVYGRLLDTADADPTLALTVLALSDRYRKDEIVEVNYLGQRQSYYGLNLPQGNYRLLVVADMNRDGAYDRKEIVGERELTINAPSFPTRVAGGIDIVLARSHEARVISLDSPIPASTAGTEQRSLFYPRGTIRSLDDPIFADNLAQLGMFDPAAFIEAAPMMFYALEEDMGHKIPVIFVHGIGGSPAQFKPVVERLDRTRYKPWFFYYPSGMDLNQLSRFFYDLFLSGKVISTNPMPLIIVAHSMGGLVTREAMNLFGERQGENKVAFLVTLVSPFGGDPATKLGLQRAPMVVPAWRHLDPQGGFVTGLFRKPLPSGAAHQLIYAYRDTDDLSRGSDGTVSLISQLPPAARAQAADTVGFQGDHMSVLADTRVIDQVLNYIESVRNPLPADHLRYAMAGGFDVPLGAGYSEIERYVIRTYGLYYRALATGRVVAVDSEQMRFVQAARGEVAPEKPHEFAWLKFKTDYPTLAKAGSD